MAEPTVPYDGPIVTRDEARANGSKFYFSGQTCKHGHREMRITNNGNCLPCRDRLQKKWRAENPEKGREYNQKYYYENVEASRAYHADWKKNNAESIKQTRIRTKKKNAVAILEYSRSYYQKNKEKQSERSKLYRAKNPEIIQIIHHRRRDRIASTVKLFTVSDIKEIRKSQRNRCAYCRISLLKAKEHLDHIISIAKGGSNDRRNIQLTCAPCNQSKSSSDPMSFARRKGLLL